MTHVFDRTGFESASRPTPKWPKGAYYHALIPFVWATIVATGLSTEFLFQAFIWRNFDLGSIFAGWLSIWRDRLVVSWTLAACLSLTPRLRGGWALQLVPFLAAVVFGAALGETILGVLTPDDQRQSASVWLGRVLRWTLVGSAIAIIIHFWRSALGLAAESEESRVRAASLRRSAASSELEMLRRQIEPHFLFNTLATIRRLCDTDPDQSRLLLSRLLQFLSATIGEDPERPSRLADEIELVAAYLEVCASRMGGRLTFAFDIEPDLEELAFPPLVLATLAENAIKHGIFPQNGGSIQVLARRSDGSVEVSVVDDGAGLTGESGSGIGLANIVERLRLLYGSHGELRLRANHPKGVIATVRLPGDQK